MQGLTLLTSMPKLPAGGVQAEGGSGGAPGVEDVDFAAMLAAQIKGGSAGTPVIAATDSVTKDLVLADGASGDVKAADVAAAPTVDPMLAGFGFVPVLPPQTGVQQTSSEPAASKGLDSELVVDGVTQPVSTEGRAQLAVVSGRAPVDQKAVPVQSSDEGTVELAADSSQVMAASSGREKVAEFAVGGKALPPEAEIKAGESRVPLVVEANPQRQPDSLTSSMSAAMTAIQPSHLADSKSIVAPTVQTPVGTAGWGDALGQKVVWMAGQQQQVAELHLNPPHLGPMEVRLTVANDQVNALFVSSQPAVRDAIEAAMPRLREMFADSGMTLGNAMVSSDSLPQQQNGSQDAHSRGASSRTEYSVTSDIASPNLTRGTLSLRGDGRGMVDLFA